jgi:hypothetical protein
MYELDFKIQFKCGKKATRFKLQNWLVVVFFATLTQHNDNDEPQFEYVNEKMSLLLSMNNIIQFNKIQSTSLLMYLFVLVTGLMLRYIYFYPIKVKSRLIV